MRFRLSSRFGSHVGSRVALLVGLAAAGLVACDAQSGTVEIVRQRRIVSLSPAFTQMAIDLGLESQIVGVGGFDPVAPAGTSVVGDLYRLDYEKLLLARPSHVLVQRTREGIPSRLEEFARSPGFVMGAWEIETVDDVLEALYPLPGAPPGVGELLGEKDLARLLAANVRTELIAIGRLVEHDRVPRVLLLVGLNPLTAVGSDTFLGELLLVAGGENALGKRASRYPVLDREELLAINPHAIVSVRASRENLESSGESLRSVLAELELDAVREERLLELEDEVALLPSTSMPRVARKLARLLHPREAARIDAIPSRALVPAE